MKFPRFNKMTKITLQSSSLYQGLDPLLWMCHNAVTIYLIFMILFNGTEYHYDVLVHHFSAFPNLGRNLKSGEGSESVTTKCAADGRIVSFLSPLEGKFSAVG